MRQLTAKKIRSMVTCLNGENNSIQPYKDFLDSTADSDLNASLEIYNRHINSSDNRLNKILDLVSRMDTHGFLDGYYKNIQVLGETQTLQKALPLARHLVKDEKDFISLARYAGDVIKRDQLSPAIVAGANTFSGLRARVLSVLFSKDDANSVVDVNQTTNLAADIILHSITDGNFHGVLTHLSDAQFGRGLKLLTDLDLINMGDLLDYLPLGNTTGGNRLERLRKTINGADRPLTCFQNGTSNRKHENIWGFFAREVNSLTSTDAANRFFLQTVPLLLATSKDSCDYHTDLTSNIDLLSDLALRGYGVGIKSSLGLLDKSKRLNEWVRVVKSDYVTLAGPLLEEIAARGASRFLLELMAKDLTETDLNTLSVLLNYLVLENLSGKLLVDWINLNIPERSRIILLTDLNSLVPEKRDFINLSVLVAGITSQDQALRDLKDAVAKQVFTNSAEASLQVVLRNILAADPQRRIELVAFAKSFKKSLADQRGGLGMSLGVAAQTLGLASERPVQEVIRDTLLDEKLLKNIAPVLYNWFTDNKFINAVAFTGTIAGNGQLKVLVKFLVEIFKNSQNAGMGSGSPQSLYVPNQEDPNTVLNNITPFTPAPPSGDYTSCAQLQGSSLFSSGGNNLYLAMKCINAEGSVPVIGQIAEQLKGAGLLESAAELLRTTLVTSPYLLGTLSEIERIFKSGDLTKIFKLISISGESPYTIPYRFDGLLSDIFSHSGADHALQMLGKITQMRDFTQMGVIALNLKNQGPVKVFESDNNFRIKITTDPKIIKDMKKNIKDVYTHWSQSHIDAEFNQAVENFETRNNTWLYETGLYPRLNNQQWKEQIIVALRDSLRTTDLHELIAALKDLHKNYNMPRFLMESIRSQRLVVNYMPDGSRKIHIVTRLDQLETLVNVADIDVPIGGISHVGTDFQLGIIKGVDLSEVIKSKHSQLNIATALYGNSNRGIHLKNMEENIDALHELAANGDLRVLKRLYIALQNATPEAFKWKDDPINNHMGSLRYMSYVGLFNLLTQSLSHAAEKGYAERIINGVLSVISLIQPDDIEPLKKVIDALLTKAQQGDLSPIEILIDKLLAIQENNLQGYKNFKDSIFHNVINIEAPTLKLTSLLQGLPFVINKSVVWNDLTDTLVEDSTQPQGGALKLGANLLTLDSSSWNVFIKFIDTLLTLRDSRSAYLLPSLMKLTSDGYAKRPGEFSQINSALNLYSLDPRVVEIKPSELIKSILNQSSGQSGVGDGLAFLLQDDMQRKRLIDVGLLLAKNNQVSGLSRVLIDQINNGN
ncbi:MAG: hypothetical protein SGI74_10930 [Oligoflexia bacterium]|nr:hypothetical protein [Oligoflexia bacterium]